MYRYRQQIGALLVLVAVLWATGFPYLDTVNAAQLTNVKDTLSDSNLSSLAKHTVAFTATNASARRPPIVGVQLPTREPQREAA
jgi:hypothetical protein